MIALLAASAVFWEFPPAIVADTLEEVVFEASRGRIGDEEGRQTFTSSLTEEEDGAHTLVVTVTGLTDDSVRGRRTTWRVTERNGEYTAAWDGDENQCRRGPTASRWRTEPCP